MKIDLNNSLANLLPLDKGAKQVSTSDASGSRAHLARQFQGPEPPRVTLPAR